MNLSGMTIFKTGKGWQFSFREEGENGWQVFVGYPDEKAQKILKLFDTILDDCVPKSGSKYVPGVLDLRPNKAEKEKVETPAPPRRSRIFV